MKREEGRLAMSTDDLDPPGVAKILLVSMFAGAAALGFNFLLRLGNITPYPPESALESFLKVIPETIQEASVQNLGEFAGRLGLVLASAITTVVYGVLGLLFQRLVLRRVTSLKALAVFEMFLSFSIVPFVIFGFILLPLFGDSLFGLSSPVATTGSNLFFPLSLSSLFSCSFP